MVLASAFLLGRPLSVWMLAPGGRAHLLVWLLLFQSAALAMVVFVPFGFDRPSPLGLDFTHMLVLATLYGVAAILGSFTAMQQRRWLALAFQIAMPVAFVLLLAAGSLAI